MQVFFITTIFIARQKREDGGAHFFGSNFSMLLRSLARLLCVDWVNDGLNPGIGPLNRERGNRNGHMFGAG